MEKNIKQTLLDKTPKETKKKVAEYSDLMVASAILDEWIEKPENKHLGARASALKFASYYHKHKTSEQTFTKGDMEKFGWEYADAHITFDFNTKQDLKEFLDYWINHKK